MQNRYSLSEFIKTLYSYILTKAIMPNARLIRRPIYIRGKKSIKGCKSLTTGRFCRFDLDGNKTTLIIGDDCEFGDFTHIVAHKKVIIGNNVLIASKCFISDTSHGSYKGDKQSNPMEVPKDRELVSGSVKIGNNVWIGENVVIISGAEIGDGCVIGANAVVNKPIKANSMVIGVNKIIKEYNDKKNVWEIV